MRRPKVDNSVERPTLSSAALRVIRRSLIGGFLSIGIAVPVFAQDPLTAQQKQAVDQLIHDYLLNHPEVVLEALKAAQVQSEAEATEQTRRMIVEQHDALVADPDSPVGGNPEGDVTVVEFFDYRCPYCKEVEPSLEALVEEDAKLRIVYKEYPILGPSSVFATRMAFAARKQGKYNEFHRAMMATTGTIDDEVVLSVADSVGLDRDRAIADANAPEIDKLISANMKLAETLNLTGTPTFIIGDMLTPGAIDIDALRKAIASLRNGG